MRLLSTSARNLTVSLTRDELILVTNGLNEALELVDEWEFSTRVGFDRGEAEELHRHMSAILGETPP